MSARDDAVTSLVNGGWVKQIAREIVASVVAETRAEEQRLWAARIRETGTAKGWSTWAAAYMDPDVEFVDTDMPATETIVAELRRLDRETVLRAAESAIAAAVERNLAEYPDEQAMSARRLGLRAAERIVRGLREDTESGEKEPSSPNEPPTHQSTVDAGHTPEPLVVARYDVCMEPAPEEEPVFTVGAVAEDGRPVALLFDEENRNRVAGWLAPGVAELRHVDRAATLQDASARLMDERRRQYASRAIFSDGIAHAASLVQQWADETEPETSGTASERLSGPPAAAEAYVYTDPQNHMIAVYTTTDAREQPYVWLDAQNLAIGGDVASVWLPVHQAHALERALDAGAPFEFTDHTGDSLLVEPGEPWTPFTLTRHQDDDERPAMVRVVILTGRLPELRAAITAAADHAVQKAAHRAKRTAAQPLARATDPDRASQ